jgi:hypothetical protein
MPHREIDSPSGDGAQLVASLLARIDGLMAARSRTRLRFYSPLEADCKSYEIHRYAGALHGWLNDTMPGRYCKRRPRPAGPRPALTQCSHSTRSGVIRTCPLRD